MSREHGVRLHRLGHACLHVGGERLRRRGRCGGGGGGGRARGNRAALQRIGGMRRRGRRGGERRAGDSLGDTHTPTSAAGKRSNEVASVAVAPAAGASALARSAPRAPLLTCACALVPSLRLLRALVACVMPWSPSESTSDSTRAPARVRRRAPRGIAGWGGRRSIARAGLASGAACPAVVAERRVVACSSSWSAASSVESVTAASLSCDSRKDTTTTRHECGRGRTHATSAMRAGRDGDDGTR